MPEDKELPPVHLDPKRFMEERGEGLYAEAMCDVLVREPTHEAMKMSRHTLIAIRDKQPSQREH